MKEGFPRRNFLKGSVAAAMAMGAESVEARELTKEELELAEALRQPVRELLDDAYEVFSAFELSEVSEYAKAIRSASRGAESDIAIPAARSIMNLFLMNSVDGHPNRVRDNAEAVIRDMQRFLLREASYIANKGLKKEAERLQEKLRDARSKITDILAESKRRKERP